MDERPRSSSEEKSKENVHYLRALIDKFVTVEVIQNCTYSGFVHCIDPVSNSIILSVPSGETYSTVLIPGHAVITILETPAPSHKNPTRKPTTLLTNEEIIGRKQKIVSWLKKNLLPVSEKDNVIDLGHVSILPPYSLNNICTENPVVALQIRKLIESMPVDFVS